MERRNLHPRIQLLSPGKSLSGNMLEKECSRLSTNTMPDILVVDLREVRRACSAWVAWLVNLRLMAMGSGRTLVLLGPGPDVLRVLRAARIGNRFDRVSSLDEIKDLARSKRTLIRMRSES